MKRIFLATSALALTGGLAAAALTSSCDAVCTDEVFPSVVVHVQAPDGSPLPADNVTFSVLDGTAITTATCATAECSEWNIGEEQTGDFLIDVEACDAHATANVTVDLTADGCHVDTQHVYVMPDTSDCTFETPPGTQPPAREPIDPNELPWRGPVPKPGCEGAFVPSVILEIVDGPSETAGPVGAEKVWYDLGEVQAPTEAICVPHFGSDPLGLPPEVCSKWLIGLEQAGEFDIYATVCNQRYHEVVNVGFQEDGCHVVPERIKIVPDITECPQ